MHISDNILTPAWCGLWFLAAAPFLLWGLWCLGRRRAAEPRTMVLTGLVGSAVFVVSCLHVPIPWLGTCSHPCGTGLAAILIGPGPTIVVSALALLFQLLMLQEGGFTTLGANLVSMGVVGALCGAGCFQLLRRLRLPVLVAAFAAGTLSDWAVYAASSFQLASARHGDAPFWGVFATVVAAYMPTQVPLGIFEGFLTALAYRFIMVRRPELLVRPLRVLPLILACLGAGFVLGGDGSAKEDSVGNALCGVPSNWRQRVPLGGTPRRAFPTDDAYDGRPPSTLARSASEGRDIVPRLRFGLVCGLVCRPACGLVSVQVGNAPSQTAVATKPEKTPPTWQAADDMVEQRFAAKGETKPAEPAENRGELPGFFAMLAGAIGGFIAGYCFRALFPPRPARNCCTSHAPREAEPTEPHAEREAYHGCDDPKPRTPEDHAPGR